MAAVCIYEGLDLRTEVWAWRCSLASDTRERERKVLDSEMREMREAFPSNALFYLLFGDFDKEKRNEIVWGGIYRNECVFVRAASAITWHNCTRVSRKYGTRYCNVMVLDVCDTYVG